MYIVLANIITFQSVATVSSKSILRLWHEMQLLFSDFNGLYDFP